MRQISDVHRMDIGPNTAASLSTMELTEKQRRASRLRRRALSGTRTVRDPVSGAIQRAPSGEPRAQGLYRVWLSYRELAFRNTWLTPLVIILAMHTLFYIQLDHTHTNILHPFLYLSYEIPGTSPRMYGKGGRDLAFVAFYTVFFMFFRDFCMQMILRPLSQLCGINQKAKRSRFLEQTYVIIYNGISAPFGLYIMYHSPQWFFNTKAFYVGYPHRSHEFLFKLFYLLQAAFWSQQAIVLMLQLERPRKDFKELVFHHVVTLALIFSSYRFHFAKMGLAVYITMDVSDLFLALAKSFNYCDFKHTDVFFFIFMMVWIYTRHYLNIRILWSIATEFATIGDFTLNWQTEQYKCWISQFISFSLLSALFLVNTYWLFLILRIAYRALCTSVYQDMRSEDEDEQDSSPKDPSNPHLPQIRLQTQLGSAIQDDELDSPILSSTD